MADLIGIHGRALMSADRTSATTDGAGACAAGINAAPMEACALLISAMSTQPRQTASTTRLRDTADLI